MHCKYALLPIAYTALDLHTSPLPLNLRVYFEAVFSIKLIPIHGLLVIKWWRIGSRTDIRAIIHVHVQPRSILSQEAQRMKIYLPKIAASDSSNPSSPHPPCPSLAAASQLPHVHSRQPTIAASGLLPLYWHRHRGALSAALQPPHPQYSLRI